MIILSLKNDWAVAKARLKERFSQLDEDDLVYETGREDALIERIQQRVGLSREEIECRVHEAFGN